jgi:hypothetical protein
MTNSTDDSDLKERERIYYSAIVDAFIDSSMERDRSLLTLSSAGIALDVTLMTTVGVHSTFELILYILSVLLFGSAIIFILHVFKLNKEYLLRLASGEKADDPKLKKADNAIYALFVSGIILLFAVALSSAVYQLNHKENHTMSSEEKKSKRLDESLDNLSKLGPEDIDAKKSLNGLSQLKPKPDSSDQKPDSSSENEKPTK